MSNPQRRRELKEQREAEAKREAEVYAERAMNCYQVKDHAVQEYLALEDLLGAKETEAIANLIKAMIESKDDDE